MGPKIGEIRPSPQFKNEIGDDADHTVCCGKLDRIYPQLYGDARERQDCQRDADEG